jgi:hypothetical protein
LLGEWIDADADPEDNVKPVKFDIGLDGFMCLLKTKPPWHLFLGHAHGEFTFMGLDTRLLMETLPNKYSSGRKKTIVGFSLSCDNERDEDVEFTITEGGILSSSLLIDVKAPYDYEWHCRVFFVGDELGRLANRVDGVKFWCATDPRNGWVNSAPCYVNTVRNREFANYSKALEGLDRIR